LNNPVKPAFIWLINARQMLNIARHVDMKNATISDCIYLLKRIENVFDIP